MPVIRKMRSSRNKNKLTKAKRKSLKHNNKSRNKFRNKSRSKTKRSKLQKGGSEHINTKSKNIIEREEERKRKRLLHRQQRMKLMLGMLALQQPYPLPNQTNPISLPVNINKIRTIKQILMEKQLSA